MASPRSTVNSNASGTPMSSTGLGMMGFTPQALKAPRGAVGGTFQTINGDEGGSSVADKENDTLFALNMGHSPGEVSMRKVGGKKKVS